jgi:hypothetical protein
LLQEGHAKRDGPGRDENDFEPLLAQLGQLLGVLPHHILMQATFWRAYQATANFDDQSPDRSQ